MACEIDGFAQAWRECESGGEGEQDFGIHFPSAEDWGTGFVHMAIPQIPLTTLNSVIAVCKLSDCIGPRLSLDIVQCSAP